MMVTDNILLSFMRKKINSHNGLLEIIGNHTSPANLRGGGIREKNIESKLCRAVKKRGGLCLKFVSPAFNGVPDRIVLLSGGRIAFVEVKAPGETLRPIQRKRKWQLERLGCKVFCLDSEEKVEEVVNAIQAL